jgi:hypothetical protein
VASFEVFAGDGACAAVLGQAAFEGFDFSKMGASDVEEAGLVGEGLGDGAVAGFAQQRVGGLDEVFVGGGRGIREGDPFAGEAGRGVADSQEEIGREVFTGVRFDGAAAEAAEGDENQRARVVGGEAEGGAAFGAGASGAIHQQWNIGDLRKGAEVTVEGEAEEAAGDAIGSAIALDDFGPAGLGGLVLGEDPVPGEVRRPVSGDASACRCGEGEGRDVGDDGVGSKGGDCVHLAVDAGFPAGDEGAVGGEGARPIDVESVRLDEPGVDRGRGARNTRDAAAKDPFRGFAADVEFLGPNPRANQRCEQRCTPGGVAVAVTRDVEEQTRGRHRIRRRRGPAR